MSNFKLEMQNELHTPNKQDKRKRRNKPNK
jgi:hypothetical protein